MSLAPASNALLPVMSVIEMAFATMAPETYLPLLEVVRSLSNYLSAAYMGAQALDLGWWVLLAAASFQLEAGVGKNVDAVENFPPLANFLLPYALKIQKPVVAS